QETGIVTLGYPYEALPVPDHGRYRLHNEMDDCIVCDKCAKICPVDCIEIEPIKATEELGQTADGTTKRLYAAKFDIDMAKCCFCGLCTTVCPTECLTMTKAYDFSEYEVKNHTYAFAEMTPLEILTARQKLEEANQAKAAKALNAEEPVAQASPEPEAATPSKPVFRPKMPAPKPATPASDPAEKASDDLATPSPTKPVFKPKVKPPSQNSEATASSEPSKQENQPEQPKPRPVFRPRVPPKKDDPS
ncbi:MAG: 4Fe-4S binding protein, partial [Cytophagales bacterium]|nr:4Fe-4S binding protein [Cytophagales bacterium]